MASHAGETTRTDFVSMQDRSLRYFVSGKRALGKTGRGGVCRLTHKRRIVGRSSIFENLPKRKQAGLKVRSVDGAIRCVFFRGKGYMLVKLRNQVVQVALQSDCRRIWQPIERCPNDQQAQQTCRDFGSHRFVALCNCPSGKNVAYDRWPRQQRHSLLLRGDELYRR
jgi:hypothetical protein